MTKETTKPSAVAWAVIGSNNEIIIVEFNESDANRWTDSNDSLKVQPLYADIKNIIPSDEKEDRYYGVKEIMRLTEEFGCYEKEFADIKKYKSINEQEKILNELTQLNQDMGLYDKCTQCKGLGSVSTTQSFNACDKCDGTGEGMRDEYFEGNKIFYIGEWALLRGSKVFIVGRPAPDILYSEVAWVVHNVDMDEVKIVNETLLEKI